MMTCSIIKQTMTPKKRQRSITPFLFSPKPSRLNKYDQGDASSSSQSSDYDMSHQRRFLLTWKKSFCGQSTTKNLKLFIVEIAGLLDLRTILLLVNNVLLKDGRRSTYIGMLYLMIMPGMLF